MLLADPPLHPFPTLVRARVSLEFVVSDQTVQLLEWSIAVAASLAAAVIDVRVRRIPNLLSGPLMLAGLIWSTAVAGPAGLGASLAGMLIVGLPFFIMWMMRAGGAGDAKMMMALGAWLGVTNGVPALAGVALAGGIVALGYAIVRGQLGTSVRNVLIMMGGAVFLARGAGRFEDRHELLPCFKGPAGIPYGIAIFLGTSAAAAWTVMWRG